MIQIDITLTKADIMAARLFVYFRSGWGVAVMAVALAISGQNYVMGAAEGSSAFNAIWEPLILGCCIIPFAVMFAGINGAVVRKMLAPIQYLFDEQGLMLTAPHVTGRYDWPEVRRVYESRRLLVFTTPGSLQIVPKRFASRETLAGLKAMIDTNMKGRAKLKRP